MKDEIVGYAKDGRPVYDNTPTVVAVVVIIDGSLLLVRRNTEPGKGKIALPGGYHMRGESWQQAGAREVLEETGVQLLNPSSMSIISIDTDEYQNNVIVARYVGGEYVRDGGATDGECEVFMHPYERAIPPDEWAFRLHYLAAQETGGWSFL